MANIKTNCVACDDLKEYAPDFIQNGVTDEICASLQNDTGFNPNDDRNDCIDLMDANDCLIGNMVNEVDDYEVCDWQPFMFKFLGNLYNFLKSLICAICGIWTNIHNLWIKVNELEEKIDNFNDDLSQCTYDSMKRLLNALKGSIGGSAFVRYYRDNTGNSTTYKWKAKKNAVHTLKMYMDANVDNPGSKVADRDYLVVISYCCDMRSYSVLQTVQVWYASDDTRSIELIRKRQAQHPADSPRNINKMQQSWTISTAVLVKKGAYLKFNAYDSTVSGTNPWYRVHQITATWIPVNLGSINIDPNIIMPC